MSNFPLAEKAAKIKKRQAEPDEEFKRASGNMSHRSGGGTIIVNLGKMLDMSRSVLYEKQREGLIRRARYGQDAARRQASVELALMQAFKQGKLDTNLGMTGSVAVDDDGRIYKLKKGGQRTELKGLQVTSKTPEKEMQPAMAGFFEHKRKESEEFYTRLAEKRTEEEANKWGTHPWVRSKTRSPI